MSIRLAITLATLILLPLSARADFTGFPLTNDLWETAQDEYQPVQQLFAAIQERALAARALPISFVEEVAVSRYGVVVGAETNTADMTTLFNDPDGFLPSGPPWMYGDPDGDGKFLVSVGPYYLEWVLPIATSGSSGDWAITIEWVEDSYISNAVVSVTLTNNIGDYDVTVGGSNYVGVTQVTRPLLTAMWDKIEEIAPSFVYPGSETNWADWWDSEECLRYSEVLRYEGALESNDVWTVEPYLPYVSLSSAMHSRGFEVKDLETNRWGIVVGGSARMLPVTSTNYWTAKVSFGQVSRGTNAWGGFADTNEYLLATNSFENPRGIDYWYYTDAAPRPVVAYYGISTSPPSVSVEFTGIAVFTEVTNTLQSVTNTVWDGDWPDGYLSCSITTSRSLTNLVTREVSETLGIGDSSTNMWTRITDISVTGGGTNADTVALEWAVGRWVPLDYRLYAEELNRMYYVLSDMQYTCPFSSGGNYPVPREPRAVVTGSMTNLLSLTGSVHKATAGALSGFSTSNGMADVAGMPYQGNTAYAFGEIDLGQAETIPSWPYTEVPDHWPHSWGDTNDVPVIINVSNRPPSLATVQSELRTLAEEGYTTNSGAPFYLPHAVSARSFYYYGYDEEVAIPFPSNTPPDSLLGAGGEYMASSDMGFDFSVGGTNWQGHIFMGDYSDKWLYAHMDCATGTVSRGDSFVAYSGATNSGPGGVAVGVRYPFTMLDPVTFEYLDTTIPFDGNGVLTTLRTMEDIAVSGGSTNFEYTIRGCTANFPERAAAPIIPVFGEPYENVGLAYVQVLGYNATHLFVILEWDFEYK